MVGEGDSSRDLETYLEANKVNRADFLEYSGEHVGHIINSLIAGGRSRIRVLLVDPRVAIATSFDQAARIVKNYRENLRPVLGSKNSQLEVGFYCSVASLRGRNFDDIYVQLSWYTFSGEQNSGNAVIRGEDNPFIATYGITFEGKAMRKFFKDQFERLWESKIQAEQIDEWIDSTYDDIAKRLRNAIS